MAETETATAKSVVKQPENPLKLDIERNGVTITFTEARTTRGQEPGKMTFIPNFENEAQALLWVGVSPEVADALRPLAEKSDLKSVSSNTCGIEKGKVKTLALGWAQASIDPDTGEFIQNKFVKFATDFSASGETIGELEEQFEEKRDELVKLDLTDPASQAQFLALGKEMQDLTIAINSKKRTRTPKAETVAS